MAAIRPKKKNNNHNAFITNKMHKPPLIHSLSDALMLKSSQVYILKHQLYYTIILDIQNNGRVVVAGGAIMAHWPEMWGESSVNVQRTNALSGMSKMDWQEATEGLPATKWGLLGQDVHLCEHTVVNKKRTGI